MKVAAVADIKSWAFDNILMGIKKYNPDPDLQIDVFYEVELRKNRALIKQLRGYNLLFPFSLFQAGFVRIQGFNDYITMVHMGPLMGVPIPPEKMAQASNYHPILYNGAMGAKRFGVISPILWEIWHRERDLRMLRVGVDPDLFYPVERISSISDGYREGPLRVGWVGNPDKPYKRFDLVKAAMKMKGVELHSVLWRRGKDGDPRPYDQMPDFYRDIDVYLCTSDHEGLPTPALEAAACGIPIVSVPVGIIKELVTDGKTGFIVSQDPAMIREKLAYLRDNRDECKAMGQKILVRAEKRLWPEVIGDWVEFMKGE